MGKCGTCKKPLTEQTIATKTKKLGGETIIVESKQALVCSEHGVVVWEPVARMVVGPAIPAPYIPWAPNPYPVRPHIGTSPYTWPNTSPPRYPTITRNTNQLSAATGGRAVN